MKFTEITFRSQLFKSHEGYGLLKKFQIHVFKSSPDGLKWLGVVFDVKHLLPAYWLGERSGNKSWGKIFALASGTWCIPQVLGSHVVSCDLLELLQRGGFIVFSLD